MLLEAEFLAKSLAIFERYHPNMSDEMRRKIKGDLREELTDFEENAGLLPKKLSKTKRKDRIQPEIRLNIIDFRGSQNQGNLTPRTQISVKLPDTFESLSIAAVDFVNHYDSVNQGKKVEKKVEKSTILMALISEHVKSILGILKQCRDNLPVNFDEIEKPLTNFRDRYLKTKLRENIKVYRGILA